MNPKVILYLLLLLAPPSAIHADNYPFPLSWMSRERQQWLMGASEGGPPNYGCGFAEIPICGLSLPGDVLELESSVVPSTRSATNTNPRLAESLWTNAIVRPDATALPVKGIIRRVDGAADLSNNLGSHWTKAKVGQIVSQGLVLRTASGSAVDLTLRDNAPLIRILADSRVQIDKLASNGIGLGKTFDTLITLHTGKIQGHGSATASAKNYLIQTTGPLIKVHDGRYEIHADGTCLVASGSAEVITPTHIYTVHAGEKYSPTP